MSLESQHPSKLADLRPPDLGIDSHVPRADPARSPSSAPWCSASALLGRDHEATSCGATSGTSGSPASTTRRSASCTSMLGLVMLLRGFADAVMMRLQQAMAFGDIGGLPAAAPLRPDLHRARRDHDLLRGHAAGHGPDELPGAAADRRARRGLPVPQQLQLLDDRLPAPCW